MKIIGHRGAAGLALENTLSSIRAALEVGVDAVEIDVRLTRDGAFVLCHDNSFSRLGGESTRVCDLGIHEVLQQKLRGDEKPLTLDEALKATRKSRLIIEAKGSGWASELAEALSKTDQDIIVIALDHRELKLFKDLSPGVPTYVVQRFNPGDTFQSIHDAHRLGFTGVDLNFWLLNPLTYGLLRRHKLDIIVYTVDWRWIARFLIRLFPEITITTNRPDKMQGVFAEKERFYNE